jgi:hypothetical protein
MAGAVNFLLRLVGHGDDHIAAAHFIEIGKLQG